MSTVPEHPYFDDCEHRDYPDDLEVSDILTNPTSGMEVHDIID